MQIRPRTEDWRFFARAELAAEDLALGLALLEKARRDPVSLINERGVLNADYLREGMRDLTRHRGAYEGVKSVEEANAIASGEAPAKNTGRIFDPIKVTVTGGEVYLEDGRHRVAAAAEAGATKIRATVRTYARGKSVRRDALVSIHALAPADMPKAPKIRVLSRRGFDDTVRRLVGKLTTITGPADAKAVRAAARALDRRWDVMPEEERNRVIRAAAEGLLEVPKVIVPKVDPVVREAIGTVVRASKEATAAAHGLLIGGSFTAQDERVVNFAATAQGSYITDQYGVRAAAYEQKARDIVSDGLAQGLGRDDISERLAAELTTPALARGAAYWDQVASIHVARARSYGQMAAYTDAGIQEFRISAALDEVTCVICRFMNAKTFDVSAAMDTYARVAASDDPYAVEDEQPFLRVGRTDDGERFLFASKRGTDHPIARVVSDATGERDETGRYSHAASSSTISAVGCSQPPFHGSCRCLTVPA